MSKIPSLECVVLRAHDDEITLTEYAFMAGRKMNAYMGKKQNWREHIDNYLLNL